MPTEQSGLEDLTPASTKGFGPREDADATRQAQHSQANDTPTDVNLNAVVAREQAGTFTQMGKEFAAAASRRDNIANAYMGTSMHKAAS